MAESCFTNAFAHGRAKADVLLETELKKLPQNASVLDVGCGTGVYVFHLWWHPRNLGADVEVARVPDDVSGAIPEHGPAGTRFALMGEVAS